MVFWAVCLLVPAATYGFILIDIVKFLLPRRELGRLVVTVVLVFGLILGTVWLWNYQVSMVLFTVPFLIAPPVKLVLLVGRKLKDKQRWQRLDVAKVGGLCIVSISSLTLLVIMTMVALNSIAPDVFPRLPFSPQDGPTGRQAG